MPVLFNLKTSNPWKNSLASVLFLNKDYFAARGVF
jgi:hypothetical protein